MKKYQYVFLIPSLRPGGAEKNCIVLANAFIKKDKRVSIWIRERSANDLRHRLSPDVDVVIVGGTGVVSTSYHLIRLIRKSSIESILAFNYFWLGPALIAKFIFKKNVIINFRVISSLETQLSKIKPVSKKILGYLILKLIARFSNTIIAQCEAMKLEASQFTGAPIPKFRTIYNPVELFNSSKKSHREHEILFVGRLVPLKGLDYLLSGFKKLVAKDPRVILRIIGEGPLRSIIEKQVSEAGLGEKVFLEGYQENISPFYFRAKVTVLTSHYEGFPNVLVESISHGTPVVSFDCKTGPSEIIIENINGYLVKYLDTDDLCDKLYLALNSTSFTEEKIMETARKYDLEKITDQYLKAISYSSKITS